MFQGYLKGVLLLFNIGTSTLLVHVWHLAEQDTSRETAEKQGRRVSFLYCTVASGLLKAGHNSHI